MPINITLDQANEIIADRANGSLTGTSAGKGGRAWLDGEWRLDELEALCVRIRHEAGAGADGAEEWVARWGDTPGTYRVYLSARIAATGRQVGDVTLGYADGAQLAEQLVENFTGAPPSAIELIKTSVQGYSRLPLIFVYMKELIK